MISKGRVTLKVFEKVSPKIITKFTHQCGMREIQVEHGKGIP